MKDLVTVVGQVTTMTSTQLADMLGYSGKEIKKKIRAMFGEEKARENFSPTFRANGQVDFYNLPELESKMFVAKWDIDYLQQITQFWIDNEVQSTALPESFSEALLLAGKIQAEKEALQIENKVLKPKAAYFEMVEENKSSLTIGAWAKELGLKPNKSMAAMRKMGYIFKKNSNNLPYQRYIDNGYFETIRKEAGLFVILTTLITPKGQLKLADKLTNYFN